MLNGFRTAFGELWRKPRVFCCRYTNSKKQHFWCQICWKIHRSYCGCVESVIKFGFKSLNTAVYFANFVEKTWEQLFEEAMITKMVGRFSQTQNGWISKTTWKLRLFEGNLDLWQAWTRSVAFPCFVCFYLWRSCTTYPTPVRAVSKKNGFELWMCKPQGNKQFWSLCPVDSYFIGMV